MTYKESLFFVGQCLTINFDLKNKRIIEKQLKDSTVDWDAIVKLSTGHFVFPALYCNLKRAFFLHYIPKDLIQYMEHITDLNRKRNQKIILQAKEINELLTSNEIKPIFLKGTGNLLENLYEDIGERMVGDIDFIVSKKEYNKAINILKKYGYKKVFDNNHPEFKHYPRLHKEEGDNIAALEVHKELLIEKYASEFNYDIIKNDIQLSNNFFLLSYENQVNLTLIAKQINDKGIYYKNISLRNSYDLMLLSMKTDTQKSIIIFNKLFNPLNNYLALTHEIMGKISTIKFFKNDNLTKYLDEFYVNSHNKEKREEKIKLVETKILIQRRLNFIKKLFIDKKYRNWIIIRLKDKKWKQEKFIKYGLSKKK